MMTRKDYIKFAQLFNSYVRFAVESGHEIHEIGNAKLNLGGVITSQ